MCVGELILRERERGRRREEKHEGKGIRARETRGEEKGEMSMIVARG